MNKVNMTAGLFECYAKEVLNGSDTAQSLTSAVYNTNTPKRAVISVDTQGGQVRYWYNGDNPTTTEGHLMNPTDTLTLVGSQNISNFKAINAVAGTNFKLMVSYEK